MNRYILQQPVGIRPEGRYGVTIPCRWITGWRRVGFARLPQLVGEQVHALPQAKHDDVQYWVEGVRVEDSLRGGDSV